MSDESSQSAPYKHSDWKVGELQYPIGVQISPKTMQAIGRVIAESIEDQFPALRVCVVEVPHLLVRTFVVSKENAE